MRRSLLLASLLVLVAIAVYAQDTWYTYFTFDGFIPSVRMNSHSADLQASVFPEMYQERSARRDIRWVAANDSALTAFWSAKGDSILHILRELSGIEWLETQFDIYLVRHYPSLGSSEPLIIPMDGFGRGEVLEAAPRGRHQRLNLIFQLSRRMLAQADQPERGVRLGIAYHPLMRPSPLRRDNLAWLLALSTAQNVLGIDSTYDAYNSAFWKNHIPGRRVFEEYLRPEWNLSPQEPLSSWIKAEPYGSELVNVTRPPRRSTQVSGESRMSVEGLPLEGELGFSVTIDETNRLVVNKIDVTRLAYASGLREGDRIYTVDGRRPRHQRDLIQRILAGLDENGMAVLQVIREGQTTQVILQPFMFMPDNLLYPSDDLDSLEQNQPDTTMFREQ
jgi:hypothetical protein